jgi:predicted transcriptional regulator
MEEFTVELDDETAEWLESSAAAEKKSPSEFIEELIQELRRSSSADAGPE